MLNSEYQNAYDFITNSKRDTDTFDPRIAEVYVLQNEGLEYWSHTNEISSTPSILTITDTIENGIIHIPLFNLQDSMMQVRIIDKLSNPCIVKYASVGKKTHTLNIAHHSFPIEIYPLTNEASSHSTGISEVRI